MSNAIPEKNDRDPMEELQAWFKAFAEHYPELPDKLPTRVEQLENEIVELKNEIAAKDTIIKHLEQRLVKFEAV